MVTKENVAIIIPFHKNIEMLRLSIHTLEESIIEVNAPYPVPFLSFEKLR